MLTLCWQERPKDDRIARGNPGAEKPWTHGENERQGEREGGSSEVFGLKFEKHRL